MAKSTYSGGRDNNPIDKASIKKDNTVILTETKTLEAQKLKLARKTNIDDLKDKLEKNRQAYLAGELEENKYKELRKKYNQEIQAQSLILEHEAYKKSQEYTANKFKNLTAFERKRALQEQINKDKQQQEDLKNNREAHKEKIKLLEEFIANIETSEEDRQLAQETLNALKEKELSLDNNIINAIDEMNEITNVLIKAQFSFLSAKEKQALIDEKITEENAEQAKLRQELVDLATDPAEYLRRQGIELNADTAADQIRDAQAEIAKKMQESVERAATMIAAAGEDVRAAAEAKVNDEFLENLKKIVELKTNNAAKKEILSKDSKSSERKAAKETRALERESQKLDKQEEAKQANEDFGPLLKENIRQSVSAAQAITAGFKVLDDLAKSVDTNIDSYYEYQATINARLQGTNETFDDISHTIKKNVGFSGIISQKQIVENIKELTDKGIAYNLELRAFLATTSDKIADTFNAFDSNLLRMIRVQQADTTAARLGMEASLVKLFNTYFSDSSYLTDGFDQVTAAILDSSAQMSRDNSIAFEYIVQKWLGSLYSLGLSQEAVGVIAEGINYLGTGNIEALNSNDSMRTLFAMSASNAGLDFGQLLLDGLKPDTTNLLLKSMVEYLADISSNTSTNKVTKSVYAELFGVSTTDLDVFTNLASSADTIYQSTQTYQQSMNEVSSQLSQVGSRMHISQIVDTAFDNIMLQTATNIGGNAATYGLWKTLNVIEGLSGGIPIPKFSVMGNFVDLNTTVVGLVKGLIAGGSMMSSLLSGLYSGNLFGTLDLKSWGFDEYTSRGQSITALQKGMKSGVSEQSTLSIVGNSSAEDIKSASMTDATDSAKEDSEITNKDVAQNVDIYDQMRDAIYKDEGTTVLTELVGIRARLDKPFKTEIDAIHSLYRKVWRVQARILGEGQAFYSEEVVDTGGDQGITSKDNTAQEINSKIEESNNQLNQELSNQITQNENVLNSLVTESTNASNYSADESTLINGTDALGQLLSLLSLDRVFQVAFDASLTEASSSNIFSQLIQGGNTASSTSIIDQIENSSIMDSISELHADVTTVKSTLGITEGGLEGGKVVVTGMSDEMKSYINNAIKTMIAQAFVEKTATESTSDPTSLMSSLQEVLSLMNLNVTVTNDFFSEFLQKNAFSN